MDILKWLSSLTLGALATFFNQYGVIITVVILSVIIDCATGLIKAKVTDEGWDSKKANKGFWKKVALLAALMFGMLLDFFIPGALASIGIVIPFRLPFALVIGCYISINESISICENLYLINPVSMPRWIVKLLKVAKEDIDKNE